MAEKKFNSISNSAVVMITMRWIDRLIGIASTLILARLLVPDDFGIVAMASLVVGFADVIFDLGVNVALIQKKSPEKSFYNTAWTLRILQSTCVVTFLFLMAPFAADYYNDERVTNAIRVMALSMFIMSFENVGIVNFQKELNFIADAKFTLSKRLISFFIAIILTLIFNNYWGMILGTLCGRFFSTILSYFVHPMRPWFSLAYFKDIFSISQWVLIKNISQYLDRSLHIIFVGGISKTNITGGYTLAGEISDMPGSDLLAPINRVLFPAFARVKDDRNELTKLLLLAQSIQIIVTFPVCIGLILTASEFVPVALGEKWIFIIPFIQILALSNIIQSISSSANYVLTVIGQIRVLAITSWAQILIFGLFILLLRSQLDAVLIAKIRFFSIIFAFTISYYILTRYVPTVSIFKMIKGVIRPTLGCSAMIAALLAIDNFILLPIPVMLAVKVAAGIVVYSVAVLVLWLISGRPDGAESYLIEKIGRSASKK